MLIMVGGERTTCATTASSLKLRRANARRPLTHSLRCLWRMGGGFLWVRFYFKFSCVCINSGQDRWDVEVN